MTKRSFFPITPVEVAVGATGSWQDVDVKAYVPSIATGVILHVVNTDIGDNHAVGLRKKGSTDDRTAEQDYISHCWAAIGIDANQVFQAYVASTTYIDIYLVGYTTSGVTFFTNAYDKSLGATGSWQDIDCSSEAPNAIGLIFEVVGDPELEYQMGLRKNGSTDNRIAETWGHNVFGVIVGCDESQVCEGYIQNANVDFFLVGYITEGAVFNTNATDLSLGATGSWQDLAALPAGSVMGFIEVNSVSNDNYGLRKNGSDEEIYRYAYYHPWAFVECDANRVIEGKIENAGVDFFLVGYATAMSGPLPMHFRQ
jgi:hypothetical protein